MCCQHFSRARGYLTCALNSGGEAFLRQHVCTITPSVVGITLVHLHNRVVRIDTEVAFVDWKAMSTEMSKGVKMEGYFISYEPRHEKTGFCLGENKGTDQLRSNHSAKLHGQYNNSSTYTRYLKILALFCGYKSTGRFVSDLVGNPEDRFSRVAAHMAAAAFLAYPISYRMWLALHLNY